MRHLTALLLASLMSLTALAQRSPDFAEKFMQQCKSDTTVHCVTVSPKMMEQMARAHVEGSRENILQAIAKLKSARIVTAHADYFHKAEELLLKNSSRFHAERDYRKGDEHGAFFTRKNRDGDTVELIMLHEDCTRDRLTIINLTGDIDEEFLCFLYNIKTFKD